MNTRALNLLVYCGLVGVAFLVLQQVQSLPAPVANEPGSAFFPKIISWLLIALCGLGAIKAIISGDTGKLEIPRLARLIISMAIIGVWVLAWQMLGHFYLLEFVLLVVMFSYYRWPIGLTARRLAENVVLALAVTVLCYLVFNKLIYVDL